MVTLRNMTQCRHNKDVLTEWPQWLSLVLTWKNQVEGVTDIFSVTKVLDTGI